MIGIEQQFLEAPGISHDIFGDICQRAMALVDVLDLPIAALEQWNTLEHFQLFFAASEVSKIAVGRAHYDDFMQNGKFEKFRRMSGSTALIRH